MQKYSKVISEIVNIESANKLIVKAFKQLRPVKGNRFGFNISLLLALFFAFGIGFSEKTVSLAKQIIGIILEIQLSVFGTVFTVFSIFLAFMNEDIIQKLASIDNHECTESMLKTSIEYFESILFLYFLGLCFTGIASFFANCISENYRLTSVLALDNALISIILTMYFFFSFRLFYEIKSIIYNTIVIFRTKISYKLLSFAQNESNEKQINQH